MTLRVTVVDEETGQTDTAVVPENDYLLLVTGTCHLAHINDYPTKGTQVLTVKGRGGKS